MPVRFLLDLFESGPCPARSPLTASSSAKPSFASNPRTYAFPSQLAPLPSQHSGFPQSSALVVAHIFRSPYWCSRSAAYARTHKTRRARVFAYAAVDRLTSAGGRDFSRHHTVPHSVFHTPSSSASTNPASTPACRHPSQNHSTMLVSGNRMR